VSSNALSNKNRFAQHSTFLYLIYNVQQHHQAAFENSIFIEQKNWDSVQTAISSLTFDQLATAAKSVLKINFHSDSIIKMLENQIWAIVSKISQSFTRMRSNRVYMHIMLMSDEMTAY